MLSLGMHFCLCVCVCVRGVIRTVKSSHLIAAILLIASPQLLFTCNLTCQDVATSTTMNKWLSFFFSFFLAHSTLHTAPHRNDCICVQWSTVKATHSAQWKSTHISICLLFVFIAPFPFSLSSFLASILSILDQTNESCRHRVIGQSVCRCMSVWGRVWMGFYCCSEYSWNVCFYKRKKPCLSPVMRLLAGYRANRSFTPSNRWRRRWRAFSLCACMVCVCVLAEINGATQLVVLAER